MCGMNGHGIGSWGILDLIQGRLVHDVQVIIEFSRSKMCIMVDGTWGLAGIEFIC